MDRRFLRVLTADVHAKDETFRSSEERDTGPLRDSFRAIGPVVPIRLQEKGGRLRIVSGFLRTEAARELGLGELDAELVRGGGDEALFLQTLHENRFTRGYSWAERSSVLHRLVTLWEMDRPRVVQEAMPALGLAPSPKLLEEHLRAAILAEPVRRALIRNECSLANALRLTRWRIEDQMALVPVLDGLHWGESLLRECLGLMWEIGMREGITAWAFLEDPEIAGIMKDPDRDPPERAAAFRAILRRRRYPTLVAMEEGFRVAHSRLRLPPGVSLQPIPFFEERGVRVAFRARAPEEFKEFCRKLWRSCEEGSRVDDLFRSTDGPVE